MTAEAEVNRLKRFEQGQAQRRRANKKRGIHVRKNRAE